MRKTLFIVSRFFSGMDPVLIFTILLLFIINGFIQYSANDKAFGRLINDLIYLALSFLMMLIFANLNYNRLKGIAVPAYLISLVLVILVMFVGIKVNGAKRWLNLGIRFQPSEFCKLTVPLVIAYFLSSKNIIRFSDYLISFILILIPFGLIIKEPDLGTGLLVFCTGFFVLFFAGLPWKIIISSIFVLIATTPLIWFFLHDYQKHRLLILLNPQADPMGKGYHIIQGMIAIGSGGFWGQGYLRGTQIHLDFIPEKHTDFIITVLAEEFGYIGICSLLLLYSIIVWRGLTIMSRAESMFAKTLAGAITMSFLLYILINIGMVSGILPVVGVPLPLISYGGTATIILMIGLGILLSIDKYSKYE